jgi:hypothetical protein
MDTGTLEDYLSWRGDLSFSEKPFNEVDNLIFCYLSYAALKGLAKEDENEKGLTLKEYVDRLMAKGGYKTNLDIYASESFLKKAASSKRFGPVILKDYVDITDTLTSIQFSAVTFQYLPKASYIAYRGTDDTTIGWKEDFMISYTKVRAQDMALEYLKNHLYPGHQDQVGGHSKGGNLALYAASLLPDELLERLTAIYLNDSPSSCPEVLDPHTFDHLQDKLVRILPEYSVIGMLFHFPVKNEKIVPSYAKGLNQHDLTTWEVRADGLVAANGLDPEAKSIDAAISGWLTNMTLLQREKFSHDLFNAITLDGKFKTVSAFRNQGMKALQGALIQLALKDPSTRATMVRLPLTVVFGRRIMGLRHHRPIEFLLNNSLPVGVFYFYNRVAFPLCPQRSAADSDSYLVKHCYRSAAGFPDLSAVSLPLAFRDPADANLSVDCADCLHCRYVHQSGYACHLLIDYLWHSLPDFLLLHLWQGAFLLPSQGLLHGGLVHPREPRRPDGWHLFHRGQRLFRGRHQFPDGISGHRRGCVPHRVRPGTGPARKESLRQAKIVFSPKGWFLFCCE